MKKNKMAVPLLLVMMLLISACSGSGSNNPGNAKNNEPDKAPTAVETGGEPKEKPTITVSVYDDGSIPAEEGTMEDNRWTEWINEHSPVQVKFISIPRWESQSKFNTLFASGSAPDLILEYDNAFLNQLYAQKLIMPLDDLIEEHSTVYKQLLEENPLLRNSGLKEDGKLYQFGRLLPIHPTQTLLIRTDWLEAVHMEVPQTTEELFEVAKAFAEMDPDGNGQRDTYGIAFANVPSGERALAFRAMFQDADWYINEQDEMVRAWDQKAAYTAFVKRLFDHNVIDKDFLTDKSGEKAEQDWMNGKAGMINLKHWEDKFHTGLLTNQPEAKVASIPLPESEFGKFNPRTVPLLQMTGVINAGAKNPEAVMQFVDFMASEEAIKVVSYGLEGRHYTTGADGCPAYDSEFDKERVYLQYYQMLAQRVILGKCVLPTQNYVHSEEAPKQDWYQIIMKNYDHYLNRERPMADIFHPAAAPALPKDLQIISAEEPAIWAKAIVSGSAYSIEQALADAQAHWQRAGGEKLEAFYKDWYANNKSTAVLSSNFYDYVVDPE
ncbi:extracellular solute-binding protein [Paenibacillus sp. 1P07SE]|uniref:extracellular solute-binding protein n=1 Tax=Paenibacillus sp. 1P07SE TaxID=3132209 RepID=UPI0039A5A0BE